MCDLLRRCEEQYKIHCSQSKEIINEMTELYSKYQIATDKVDGFIIRQSTSEISDVVNLKVRWLELMEKLKNLIYIISHYEEKIYELKEKDNNDE